MMILSSFPEYEHSHLDYECRGQEVGYIKTDMNHLSMSGTFYCLEWHLVSAWIPIVSLPLICSLVSEVIEATVPG